MIYFILFIFTFGIIICFLLIFKWIYCIQELQLNIDSNKNKIELLEKEYGKKYPLGDDYFQIIHYPKYNSFFQQFLNYKYLIKQYNNKIISTCCFAHIKNSIYYICDLKKISNDKYQTIHFIIYAYFILRLFNYKIFGIVMTPNLAIERLKNLFKFKQIFEFYLYKISFKIIKNNIHLFNTLFPDFYITPGYKIFIINSNHKLNCYHIAQPSDKNLVKLPEQIQFDQLQDDYDIMFCISTNNIIYHTLSNIQVLPINKMSVISNKFIYPTELNFNDFKTYMI